MNDLKAAILMATYNGENYICKQLDSIVEQSYTNWDLYIRDDGSTDNTLKIIMQYAERDSRIHLISYPSSAHGACLNFYHLLRAAKTFLPKYDYYFLADQDDIWEENKIAKQIDICKRTTEQYILVYSNLSLMSSDGSTVSGTMRDRQDIDLRNPYDIFFNQIFVWGNTICINKALLDFMNVPSDIDNKLSHDHYLTFYAAAFGTVIYVDEPLVRYRRHEDNVSGLPMKYNLFAAIKRLVAKKNKIIDGHVQNYNNVIYFIENAPYRTTAMEEIYQAIRDGGFVAHQKIKKYKIYPGSNRYNALINKAILYSGVHRKYLEMK